MVTPGVLAAFVGCPGVRSATCPPAPLGGCPWKNSLGIGKGKVQNRCQTGSRKTSGGLVLGERFQIRCSYGILAVSVARRDCW